MPTYEYRCRKCGHRFELFHSIKDDTIKRCPKCKGRADRLISGGAGFLFKGSGFYATDYRSSHYQEKAKQEQSGGTSEKSGGESGADKPAKSEKPREKKGGSAERKRRAGGKRSEPA